MTSLPIHRDNLGQWLNDVGLVGSMAEIGCAHGKFSRAMLNGWNGQKYIMIDPWVHQEESVYRERQEEPWKYLKWFEECSEIAGADKRVEMMRMLSHDASRFIPDGSLDCCYVDGNHSLEAVNEDLADWWPKVKPEGLFCGHDFYNATDNGYYCQVQTAVMEWSYKLGLQVVTTACSSWWVRKPL